MNRYTVTIHETTGFGGTEPRSFHFIAATNDQDAVEQARIRYRMRFGFEPPEGWRVDPELRATL
jgi:hypothetical protein